MTESSDLFAMVRPASPPQSAADMIAVSVSWAIPYQTLPR